MTNIQKLIDLCGLPLHEINNHLLTIQLVLCFLIPANIFSQQIFPAQDIVYKTWEKTRENNNSVFVSTIHSVQLHLANAPMSYPILNLNGNTALELHFDDCDSTPHTYNYTIEHYDALWQQKDTNILNYLEGFENNPLNDFALSGATSISYRHYTLQIPNNDIKITQTGNFLLKVFEQSPEEPVLTCRFAIYDSQIPVDAIFKMGHQGSMSNNSHQIDLQTDISKIPLSDVFGDLKIIIVPNNIWPLAEKNIQPKFVKGNTVFYEVPLNPRNEFRTINLKEMSLNYSDISEIATINGIQHVRLAPDKTRHFEKQHERTDMNGRFFIEKYGSWNANLDADYFYAYFSLQTEQPMLDGNIYVYGSLSNYSFSPSNIMVYNVDKGAYENRMLLKQGFYDYCYVHVNSYDASIDFDRIEGNFAQTSSDYLIYVYYRDRTTGIDKLAGFTIITSFSQ